MRTDPFLPAPRAASGQVITKVVVGAMVVLWLGQWEFQWHFRDIKPNLADANYNFLFQNRIQIVSYQYTAFQYLNAVPCFIFLALWVTPVWNKNIFCLRRSKNIVGNISRVIGGNWPKAHDGHEAESLVCRSGADVQLKKNHKYLEKNQWNFQGR